MCRGEKKKNPEWIIRCWMNERLYAKLMNYPIENRPSIIFYNLSVFPRANCFLLWHIVRWNPIRVQVKYTVIKSLLSNLNFTHKNKCQMRVRRVRAWCWALENVPYVCHFPLICVPILCEFLDCFVQKLNVDAENKTNNVKAKSEIFCLWGWDDCFVLCWTVSGALKEHTFGDGSVRPVLSLCL